VYRFKIMKRLILFFISIAVFAVVSCEQSDNALGPTEPLSREDSIKITLLKPSPTKEPYIILEDAGLEAELIAQGKDSDNQLNGKISVEDADGIEILGRPLRLIVNSPEPQYDWSYSRYFEVMPILKKEYKEETGSELIVKKLSDVNAFKNLKKLYIVFPTEVIDSLNLSANSRLEVFETVDTQIKVVDFNGCEQIKKIEFMRSPHPLVNTNLLDRIHISQCSTLEYLSFAGKAPKSLDISENVNLKHLEIQAMSSPGQIEVEKLYLCNHPHLEYLRVISGYYQSIYLAKNVYTLYEISKQQNASNGFPELNYSKGEVRACE
jgi:hypothetical protein